MITTINYHPKVQDDIEEGILHYNSRLLDLGWEFSGNVELCIGKVLLNPQIYYIVRKPNIRGAKVDKFSDYSVVYEQTSQSSINIYAVFSWKRDPKELLERFPKP